MPSLGEFLLPWGVLLVPSPFSSLPPSVPGSHHPTFCLYEFSCPGHFTQMNHTVSDLLCLALLSTNVFRVPLYCSVDQCHSFSLLNTIPLYGCATCIYPFVSCWTVGLFLPSAVMTDAAKHICVQVLSGYTFSILFSIYLGVELVGDMLTLFLIH